MIQPKKHLIGIERTPVEKSDRLQYARMDKNENIDDISQELIADVLKDVNSDFISTYPQLYPLYEKLAQKLNVGIDNLLITAGSDAAIKNVYEVYIEKGDSIVLPDPTYAMYYVYADLFQAKLKKVTYDTNLELPIDTLLNSIDESTKLVVLANPNSPTGTIVSRDNIIRIIEKAKKYDSIVLIDEAYYPYHSETCLDLLNKYDNLIITRTFSKAYGLASMRIGYAVSNEKIIKELTSFKPIYEATGISALFALKLLDNEDIIQKRVSEVSKGREYVRSEMNKLGLKTYISYANFLHIGVGEKNTKQIADYLLRKNILIKSGFSHPTLRNCIRVSIGSTEKMMSFVKAMQKYYGDKNVRS